MCSIKILKVLKDLKIGTKTICHLILNILSIQTGKNIFWSICLLVKLGWLSLKTLSALFGRQRSQLQFSIEYTYKWFLNNLGQGKLKKKPIMRNILYLFDEVAIILIKLCPGLKLHILDYNILSFINHFWVSTQSSSDYGVVVTFWIISLKV